MQIELRTQVIEPERKTFTNLAKRFGDRPASRYEEGSIDVQSVANFHYRPLWSENHEIYDVDYTAFKLTDPYSFTDPRQLYYAPYVQSRAAMNEAFVKTIDYVDSKDLLQKLPAGWDAVVGELLVPLRHWESGAQLVSIEGSRWAYGQGHDGALAAAKQRWLDAPELQGLRRLVEETLAGTTGQDFAAKLLTIDLTDRLIYSLMFTHLDEAALTGGAGAYSLLAQPFASWFNDQRRWIDHLTKVWFADEQFGESNKAAYNDLLAARWGQIVEAVSDLAAAVDARIDAGAAASVSTAAAAIAADLGALGLTVPGGNR